MKNKTIVAIIQVHMSSTRLPGKVLKDLCGMPALYRMIERMRHSKLLDDIVVATSTKPCDDIIVEKCEEWGLHWFRGSDSDVLARFWGAAQKYPGDIYVRVTSDNPLVDPGFLDDSIAYLIENDYRYVGSAENVPNGLDCEVFTAELMKEAAENSTEDYEHEHVTPYMYWKQDSVGRFGLEENCADLRFTLDTQEDYEAIRNIYEALYEPGNTFSKEAIISYLRENPDIIMINSMVKQKPVIL